MIYNIMHLELCNIYVTPIINNCTLLKMAGVQPKVTTKFCFVLVLDVASKFEKLISKIWGWVRYKSRIYILDLRFITDPVETIILHFLFHSNKFF